MEANFTGINADIVPANNVQTSVDVAEVRVGASKSYTATRTFRVNHDLDAEDGQFKLGARVTGWDVDNDDGSNAEDSASTRTDNFTSSTATYKIADDETQTYTLSLHPDANGKITEGAGGAAVELIADPGKSSTTEATGDTGAITTLTVPDFTVVYELGGKITDFASTDDGIDKAMLLTDSGRC